MNNMMIDNSVYLQPQQDSQRFLYNIRQSLVSQVTYAKACRQLIHWCTTLTLYQPQFETSLLSCLSAAATCATKPGFDMELAFQLFQSCFHFKSQASPQFNERLETFWEELNEQVAMKRNGNQEQAQKIAQQIQIQAAQQAMPATENVSYVNQHVNQHYQSTRETPEYPPLGTSETTVSVVTTIYSSMTSHSVSPSQVPQTTVSMSSSTQPSITTSSPSAISTPAETQPTNTNTPAQPVQPNSTPVATVQTAAILAAAHATATATATALTASKLSSGPPGSPSSDVSSKPNSQTFPRPQTVPTHQQLERRMSTPLTPINPLMAALSGPAHYSDTPHQLTQHMMTPLSDPMIHGLPLELHPQPAPPPYNHIAAQRALQQLPPTYQDVTSLHAAASPMQGGYVTPNKLPHQAPMGMMGPEYIEQFSSSYPPQQISFNKGIPTEMVSPYEFPPMVTRPNSLYVPPSSYDVISTNPKTFTDTRSYLTPGMGFDVMVPAPGMQSPYMNPQQNRMGISYMPMPATASPTKVAQPMQFPQHMTPNHSMMTPNYMMGQKVYPQSAPPGFYLPPEFPQLAKDYPEINKHGDQVIRLTAPIVDGILLPPFQLQHNNNSIFHKFIMKENVFPTLITRVDLDVQLRCYQSCETHLSSSWPKDQEIYVIINQYRLVINESEGKMQKPLLLKKYCVPGINTLQLNVRACCCSHMFELQLVHRPSITNVKNKITKDRTIGSQQSLNKIIELMSPRQSEDDCLHTTSNSISLKCPISQKIIEIPIRGIYCRHIQCFDLGSFLYLNYERETWKCPICGELAVAVEANYVEVDGFISKIIQETQRTRNESSEELTEIAIDDKGNWSFINVKQEKPSPNKRCKQEQDTPSPESPKKPVKRRKLSVSKKKSEKVDNQTPNYNMQQTPQNSMIIPGGATGLLMKEYAIKNFDTFSPHGMSRTPLSGPSSVESRGDKSVNSPHIMPVKNSPGMSVPDSQLDLQPSIHLDPGFSSNLLEVLQNSDPTPTDDLNY